MTERVWRTFLSGDADSGGASELPRDMLMLRTAREEAKLAKEEADKKAEQLELVTAMLQAAEEELKLRSNQLELTNAMLSALEGEVARKDEQLEITTQMLRKAEEELKSGAAERRQLRQDLAALRDELNHVTRRRAAPMGDSSSLVRSRNTATGPKLAVHGALDGEGGSVASAAQAAVAEALSASRLAASLTSVGLESAGACASLPVEVSKPCMCPCPLARTMPAITRNATLPQPEG